MRSCSPALFWYVFASNVTAWRSPPISRSQASGKSRCGSNRCFRASIPRRASLSWSRVIAGWRSVSWRGTASSSWSRTGASRSRSMMPPSSVTASVTALSAASRFAARRMAARWMTDSVAASTGWALPTTWVNQSWLSRMRR